MKYGAVILVALTLLLGGLLGCAGDDEESAKTYKTGSEVSAVADLGTYSGLAAALKNSGQITLYDVRTAEEYAAGHIPGAVNIPYDVIGKEILIKDKDSLIVVYCRSGNRSGQAKMTLEGIGYKNITNFGAVGNWLGDLVTGNAP